MVEPQIVVLVVAGSSPVGHPAVKQSEVTSEKSPRSISTSHQSLLKLCL